MINLPNLLTIFRLVLVIPVLTLVHAGYTAAALVVYLALLGTDLLDGYVARRLKQETHLGGYLDFVIDFLCYYTFLGYFIAMGRIRPYNIVLVVVGTLLLIWIVATLSKKAKRPHMPHRTSSNVFSILFSIAIGGYVIGIAHENLLFLMAQIIVCLYTIPDYLRYTLRYKAV
ncbi:CDP-alcohol phosphatidyltransferase family protein [Candidatus Zixiibacteriota bacterium]